MEEVKKENKKVESKKKLSVDATLLLVAGFAAGAVVVTTILYFCFK